MTEDGAEATSRVVSVLVVVVLVEWYDLLPMAIALAFMDLLFIPLPNQILPDFINLNKEDTLHTKDRDTPTTIMVPMPILNYTLRHSTDRLLMDFRQCNQEDTMVEAGEYIGQFFLAQGCV